MAADPPTAGLLGARLSAARLVDRFGIRAPAEIDLEAIATALGVHPCEGPLEGCEARLVRKGSQGIARVSSAIPEVGRKRFALAHEIGHWVAHAEAAPVPSVTVAICSEADLCPYNGSGEEIEANVFASELLMPTRLFRPRCAEAEPSLDLVRSLAETFRTTLTATAFRFAEETPETCLVVLADEGGVRWVSRGGKRLNLWIPHRRPLDERSAAWRVLADPFGETDAMAPVPADAWFDGPPRPDLEVREQALVLGRYGVLSLLWIPGGPGACDIDDDDDGVPF